MESQRGHRSDILQELQIPRSTYYHWRKAYENTGAMAKLLYVDRVAATYGKSPPTVYAGKLDMPVEDMTMTLDTWYEKCREAYGKRPALPQALDIDMRRLFPSSRGQSAAEFLLASRRTLVRDVNSWTGVDRHLVAGLVDELASRTAALELKTPGLRNATELARVSAFVSVLAMNYLRYRRFVPD